MERYCELIAALKVRTTNRQGHHLSTARALELLEQYGVETPEGLIQAPPGVLTRATVDRYLRRWGLDLPRLTRAPVAVRFQAEHSNDGWQFDLSPSDLKRVEAPLWCEPGRGQPTLMLFSVVDDRSGVCYQEYRCVYGEEAAAALRFLFNAMAPKTDPDFLFQGRPQFLYLDNGLIAKSRVFQRVMTHLGIAWQTHRPASDAQHHATARAKGKVERPFRTVKDAHETLYHFHQPQNEAEANLWLHRYLLSYNRQPHRSESHSRLDDWRLHLPAEGLRAMCTFERFGTFAREPERRRVGVDARIRGMCRIRVKSYHKAIEGPHQCRSDPSWAATSTSMKPLRRSAISAASRRISSTMWSRSWSFSYGIVSSYSHPFGSSLHML